MLLLEHFQHHSIMPIRKISLLTNMQKLFLACCVMLTSFSASGLLLITNLNQEWMVSIHANPQLPFWIWSFFNVWGDAWVVLLILLLSERRPSHISSWSIKTWILGSVVVQIIKGVLAMPRPASILNASQITLIDHPPLIGGSMPSGHALAAISCFLILLSSLQGKSKNPMVLPIVATLCLMAAWARVAVGAHWPADVIAGAGLAVLIVCVARVWDQKKSWASWLATKQGHFVMAVVHISIAIHLVTCKSAYLTTTYCFYFLAALSMVRSIRLLHEIFPVDFWVINKKS